MQICSLHGRFALLIALALPVLAAGCAEVTTSETLVTGSIAPADQRPSDEPLRRAKEHFAAGAYGLAEENYRAAVEANGKSIDAWIGLAASYDRLRRFDLADRAYAKATALGGHTPALLNNLGYHYLLKGDLKQARRYLNRAAQMDPGNPYIQGNLHLLETWKLDPG